MKIGLYFQSLESHSKNYLNDMTLLIDYALKNEWTSMKSIHSAMVKKT